ncbi:MAG: LysR family transcriptional regulator [Proteobacteria bacterium]|jgi:aminoethylphosphonate catabolism LysR family transcriptional regulator|nr:LysR family transcriptional regulator [Pseudomonadota bacterium]
MRLAHLRSFYAVARHGGFTAGAKALHVSQPTVTAQVRALEEAYGIELFHRRGRVIAPTPTGESLLEVASRIFEQEEEALALLRDMGELRTGRIRVGAVGPYHVMAIIAEFRRRHPGVDVSMAIGNSEQVVHGLVGRDTDVAVLAQYAPDQRLHFLPFRSHRVVITVRDDHRFARRRSLRIAELAGEPLIVRERGSTTRKALDEALQRHSVKPRIALEIGSREAVREGVIHGLGIAPVSEIEYVPHARLRAVPIGDADVRTHAHVACLRERMHTRMIAAFIDAACVLLPRAAGA